MNLVKISEGKTIKTKFKQVQNRGEKSHTPKSEDSNPVIKDTDNITVDAKVDDSTVEASNEAEPELKEDATDGVNDKSPDEKSEK